MPLIRYGDGLLATLDGLAGNEDCCCNNGECSPCCAEITGGAWVDGKLTFVDVSGAQLMNVSITTPSGTRFVCKDDIILIEFNVDPGTFSSPYAFANWDVAWSYESQTPGVGVAGSKFAEHGYFHWGNNFTSDYSISLKYNPCFNALHPGLGLIRVGFETFSLLVEIEVAPCPIQNCCEQVFDCQPCCWHPEDGVVIDDFGAGVPALYYYGGTSDLFIIARITAGGAVGEPGTLICQDGNTGDSLEIDFEIGSRNPDVINNLVADTTVEIIGWGYTSSSPDPPDLEPNVGDPGTVEWEARDTTGYTVVVGTRCKPTPRVPGNIAITVFDNTSGLTATVSLVFTKCDTPEDCNCCCPDHCCNDCFFPLSPDLCDVIPPPLAYEVGGPTKIINFVTDITCNNAVFCDNTSTTQKYEQVGESAHHFSCASKCPPDLTPPLCPQSLCHFGVNIQDATCDPAADFFTVEVYYGRDGIWSMAVGGVGYVWWVSGRTSISGSCEFGTASGYLVIGLNGFTWTTSFEVTRTMPDPAPACAPCGTAVYTWDGTDWNQTTPCDDVSCIVSPPAEDGTVIGETRNAYCEPDII